MTRFRFSTLLILFALLIVPLVCKEYNDSLTKNPSFADEDNDPRKQKQYSEIWRICRPGSFIKVPIESEKEMNKMEFSFDNDKLLTREVFNCSFAFTTEEKNLLLVKFQKVETDPYPLCLDTGYVSVYVKPHDKQFILCQDIMMHGNRTIRISDIKSEQGNILMNIQRTPTGPKQLELSVTAIPESSSFSLSSSPIIALIAVLGAMMLVFFVCMVLKVVRRESSDAGEVVLEDCDDPESRPTTEFKDGQPSSTWNIYNGSRNKVYINEEDLVSNKTEDFEFIIEKGLIIKVPASLIALPPELEQRRRLQLMRNPYLYHNYTTRVHGRIPNIAAQRPSRGIILRDVLSPKVDELVLPWSNQTHETQSCYFSKVAGPSAVREQSLKLQDERLIPVQEAKTTELVPVSDISATTNEVTQNTSVESNVSTNIELKREEVLFSLVDKMPSHPCEDVEASKKTIKEVPSIMLEQNKTLKLRFLDGSEGKKSSAPQNVLKSSDICPLTSTECIEKSCAMNSTIGKPKSNFREQHGRHVRTSYGNSLPAKVFGEEQVTATNKTLQKEMHQYQEDGAEYTPKLPKDARIRDEDICFLSLRKEPDLSLKEKKSRRSSRYFDHKQKNKKESPRRLRADIPQDVNIVSGDRKMETAIKARDKKQAEIKYLEQGEVIDEKEPITYIPVYSKEVYSDTSKEKGEGRTLTTRREEPCVATVDRKRYKVEGGNEGRNKRQVQHVYGPEPTVFVPVRSLKSTRQTKDLIGLLHADESYDSRVILEGTQLSKGANTESVVRATEETRESIGLLGANENYDSRVISHDKQLGTGGKIASVTKSKGETKESIGQLNAFAGYESRLILEDKQLSIEGKVQTSMESRITEEDENVHDREPSLFLLGQPADSPPVIEQQEGVSREKAYIDIERETIASRKGNSVVKSTQEHIGKSSEEKPEEQVENISGVKQVISSNLEDDTSEPSIIKMNDTITEEKLYNYEEKEVCSTSASGQGNEKWAFYYGPERSSNFKETLSHKYQFQEQPHPGKVRKEMIKPPYVIPRKQIRELVCEEIQPEKIYKEAMEIPTATQHVAFEHDTTEHSQVQRMNTYVLSDKTDKNRDLTKSHKKYFSDNIAAGSGAQSRESSKDLSSEESDLVLLQELSPSQYRSLSGQSLNSGKICVSAETQTESDNSLVGAEGASNVASVESFGDSSLIQVESHMSASSIHSVEQSETEMREVIEEYVKIPVMYIDAGEICMCTESQVESRILDPKYPSMIEIQDEPDKLEKFCSSSEEQTSSQLLTPSYDYLVEIPEKPIHLESICMRSEKQVKSKLATQANRPRIEIIDKPINVNKLVSSTPEKMHGYIQTPTYDPLIDITKEPIRYRSVCSSSIKKVQSPVSKKLHESHQIISVRSATVENNYERSSERAQIALQEPLHEPQVHIAEGHTIAKTLRPSLSKKMQSSVSRQVSEDRIEIPEEFGIVEKTSEIPLEQIRSSILKQDFQTQVEVSEESGTMDKICEIPLEQMQSFVPKQVFETQIEISRESGTVGETYEIPLEQMEFHFPRDNVKTHVEISKVTETEQNIYESSPNQIQSSIAREVYECQLHVSEDPIAFEKLYISPEEKVHSTIPQQVHKALEKIVGIGRTKENRKIKNAEQIQFYASKPNYETESSDEMLPNTDDERLGRESHIPSVSQDFQNKLKQKSATASASSSIGKHFPSEDLQETTDTMYSSSNSAQVISRTDTVVKTYSTLVRSTPPLLLQTSGKHFALASAKLQDSNEGCIEKTVPEGKLTSSLHESKRKECPKDIKVNSSPANIHTTVDARYLANKEHNERQEGASKLSVQKSLHRDRTFITSSSESCEEEKESVMHSPLKLEDSTVIGYLTKQRYTSNPVPAESGTSDIGSSVENYYKLEKTLTDGLQTGQGSIRTSESAENTKINILPSQVLYDESCCMPGNTNAQGVTAEHRHSPTSKSSKRSKGKIYSFKTPCDKSCCRTDQTAAAGFRGKHKHLQTSESTDRSGNKIYSSQLLYDRSCDNSDQTTDQGMQIESRHMPTSATAEGSKTKIYSSESLSDDRKPGHISTRELQIQQMQQLTTDTVETVNSKIQSCEENAKLEQTSAYGLQDEQIYTSTIQPVQSHSAGNYSEPEKSSKQGLQVEQRSSPTTESVKYDKSKIQSPDENYRKSEQFARLFQIKQRYSHSSEAVPYVKSKISSFRKKSKLEETIESGLPTSDSAKQHKSKIHSSKMDHDDNDVQTEQMIARLLQMKQEYSVTAATAEYSSKLPHDKIHLKPGTSHELKEDSPSTEKEAITELDETAHSVSDSESSKLPSPDAARERPVTTEIKKPHSLERRRMSDSPKRSSSSGLHNKEVKPKEVLPLEEKEDICSCASEQVADHSEKCKDKDNTEQLEKEVQGRLRWKIIINHHKGDKCSKMYDVNENIQHEHHNDDDCMKLLQEPEPDESKKVRKHDCVKREAEKSNEGKSNSKEGSQKRSPPGRSTHENKKSNSSSKESPKKF